MSEQEARPAKKVKFNTQVSVTEFHAHPAADTLVFHLLASTTAAELEREIAAGGIPFKCEFYNQVFGDSEEINGYKGLGVDIWLALNSFNCWVDVHYDAKQPGADDVLQLLQAWWPQPLTTDKQEFIANVTAAPALDFSQLGEPIGSVSSSMPPPGAAAGAVGGSSVKLYHSKLVDTPPWFKVLHGHLQPLLIFTIDGANFIDIDDPKWEVVAAVMDVPGGQQRLIGFMMLYNFYAWPLSTRPRVAQVLVLPPLQGGGYGKALIAAAYKLAQERDAVDLTFEDPAPGLQRLREKLELDMMAACPWLVETAAAALAAAEAEELRQQVAARQLYEAVEAAAKAKQQQQQQASADADQSAAAANGNGQQEQAGQAGSSAAAGAAAAAAECGKSPASLLSMPQELQQRVTKELKIHKHQVYAVWEALLMLQAPLGLPGGLSLDHPLQEPLQELVMSRLEAAHAAMADKHAARKRLVQVQLADGSSGENGENSGEDWFVYKLPRGARAAGGSLMSDTVNVGRHTITEMSADDWSERLQQLTGERMEQLVQLKSKVLAGQQRQRLQESAGAGAGQAASGAGS